MESNVESLEEKVNKIIGYLTLENIDNDIIGSINLFMDAYNQTLNEYLNAPEKNEELENRLRILSKPMNYYYSLINDTNNINKYPSLNIISGKLNEYGSSIEQSFTRTLTNPNFPSTYNSDDDIKINNGFTVNTILIIVTVLLGFMLGALLFIIK
jgi:hypothetical protein